LFLLRLLLASLALPFLLLPLLLFDEEDEGDLALSCFAGWVGTATLALTGALRERADKVNY